MTTEKRRKNREKFIAMWNDDVPIQEIAKEFGIKEHSVTTRALNTPECKKRVRSKLDSPKFVRMWNRKVSAKKIAETFGVSEKYVVQRASQDPRCILRRHKIVHGEFVEMWNNDCSLEEIAGKFDTSVKYVLNYASAHGDDCKKRKKIVNHRALIYLHKQGLSIKQIAEQMQISEVTARVHLNREKNR